ncbi:MAG: Gfo/Idh/MocA family protein [Pirellulaceae bacterium]
MQRREFLQSGVLAASSVLVPHVHAAPVAGSAPQELQVALIGAGYQGRILLNSVVNIGGVRVRAVCDIWKYAQNYGQKFLARHAQEVQVYEDYREMLDKEKDLDAVLIATPDFAHAAQANACLEAGLHVYCEPMLAHNLPAARSMIDTMRRTGKLLQVGYQRRSNPRYRHVLEKLIAEARLPGRITAVQTQWAQEAADLRGWPKRFTIPDDVLHRFDYDDMTQFRNWLWYPKYCGGPYCAFVSQQLDICQWFLNTAPRTVMASGGKDFFAERLSPDTVMSVYEYPHALGPVRVSCVMLTSTSGDGMRQYERFLGNEGSIQMSENPRWTSIAREPNAPNWDSWVGKNYLLKPDVVTASAAPAEDPDVHVSGEIEKYAIPLTAPTSNCQAHLENFVAAVRGEEPLRCPADAAFPSQVAAFKAMESIQAGTTLPMAASDFSV